MLRYLIFGLIIFYSFGQACVSHCAACDGSSCTSCSQPWNGTSCNNISCEIGPCSFYANCVEAAITCGRSGYALSYGEVYCDAYEQNMHLFTPAGQTWVNAVRVCLQNELISYLESTPNTTCDQLTTFAFDSHVPCYLHPANNISVCNLSAEDYASVLWTIKYAFVQ